MQGRGKKEERKHKVVKAVSIQPPDRVPLSSPMTVIWGTVGLGMDATWGDWGYLPEN